MTPPPLPSPHPAADTKPGVPRSGYPAANPIPVSRAFQASSEIPASAILVLPFVPELARFIGAGSEDLGPAPLSLRESDGDA